jgi:Holliday junction resolvase RusA-like endonuclease
MSATAGWSSRRRRSRRGGQRSRPRSAPKSRLWPDRKPDLDKLERGCLDALTSAAVIEDDARVVRLSSWKRYALPGEATGVGVTIRPAVVAEPQREDVA